MTVFEYRPADGPSRLLIVDCGMLLGKTNSPGVDITLPDWSYFADRLDDIDAVVLTHGHEDHIGALPYLLRERRDIPVIGSRLTLALVVVQARPAPPARNADLRTRPRGRVGRARPVGPAVLRRQPLDPGRAGGGDQGRRPDRPAHRRLQDGPDAARRPAHRPARVLAARRRRRRPAAVRLDQRRGRRVHPVRARRRPGRHRRHRQGAGTHHRRLLRLARAPRAAGDRRGRRVRAAGRARRPLDGAQHADRPRARAAAGAGRAAGRPQDRRRAAVAAGHADLDRLAGRAAVGAVAHGEPRATRPSRSTPTTPSCWRRR